MNTDFIVWDQLIRDKEYHKNITSSGDTRYYNDSCKTIGKYAREQNTVYDPLTNQMLYGINTNMHVSGVSDGTCNQINPTIYTPNYICGSGAAGGNRCVPDAYGIENFDSGKCNSCNIIHFVIMMLLIILLICTLYSKYSNEIMI